MLLLRPSALFLILGVDNHVRPVRVLVKEGEGTHRGDVRILLGDPRCRIGVKEAAKLLQEGSERGRDSDVRDTVDLLDVTLDGGQVIGLPRLGTYAKVAGDIQDKTHLFCGGTFDSWAWPLQFLDPKEFIGLIHLSRDPSDPKVIEVLYFLVDTGVKVG